MTLLIQVPNGGHERLAGISLHISLVCWCIHSASVKGSRTLFWQRERLEQPGSGVTGGEGAQTQTHRCYVTPRDSPAISDCLQCVKNSGKKLVFWSKNTIIAPSEEAVEAAVQVWWNKGADVNLWKGLICFNAALCCFINLLLLLLSLEWVKEQWLH